MLVKCFCNCTVIIFLLKYQFKQTTLSFILDFFMFVIKYGLFFCFLFFNCFIDTVQFGTSYPEIRLILIPE